MIHVLADQNLYRAAQFLPSEAQLTLYDPAEGLPSLGGFDALIVQTVTKLNASTVPTPPSQLKFIGTGSSGTDHIDDEYFESRGIKVVSARGCNANAVGEYVLTALLLWMEDHPQKQKLKVGVVGAGHAGNAVIDLLKRFHIDFAAYDPPRAERESNFVSATLDEVIECNVLTFHVPLTVSGKHATYHWLNENKLSGRNFELIINAARGGVIDEAALLKAYRSGLVKNYILDVWENEPDLNIEAADNAFIATPHIAGYSEQAKINATRIVCSALGDYFDLSPCAITQDHVQKRVELSADEVDLKDILSHLHPILKYDMKLRSLLRKKEKAVLFSKLRNEFPFRYEYPFLEIRGEVLNRIEELKNFGIHGFTAKK